MDIVTIDMLIDKVKSYNCEGVDIVRKAYDFADLLHSGQYRESGDPYITHPLNVAYILAEMHADIDTICAGLLHDVLEDCDVCREDIAMMFNKDVLKLVDGVTKISKMNFSSKEEEVFANTRKIILGLTDDVRIIIIKLADRLHNMRTLQYKSKFKQMENSLETMEIFVPLAYHIGAYRIKSELEDISFKYLKSDMYKKIEDIMNNNKEKNESVLKEMFYVISEVLNDENIPYDIKMRAKNIYGIYNKQKNGGKISDIHDLLALKIMVDDVRNCYVTLGLVHSKYNPINGKFKDYICNPKTNLYQSLHTTVFGPNDNLVQTQIRTFDMDKIDSFGLTAYWDINKNDARRVMQSDLKKKYQFFNSLVEINSIFDDNKEFVNQVKGELFRDKIYVYTSSGEVIEMPKGSTVIDFAYKMGTDVGNTLISARVNNNYVSDLGNELHNKDRVIIYTDDLSYGPREDWEDKAKISVTKKKIREFLGNN